MRSTEKLLARCVRNDGYEASLEKRKLYQIVPDRSASAAHMIRIVDESGESYLYPAAFFNVEGDPRADRLAKACDQLDPAEERAMAEDGGLDLTKPRRR